MKHQASLASFARSAMQPGRWTNRGPSRIVCPTRKQKFRRSFVMVDVLAARQQAKSAAPTSDAGLRTLVLISAAHWVSHFHLLVLPMLFPFLKAQLGVGYI